MKIKYFLCSILSLVLLLFIASCGNNNISSPEIDDGRIEDTTEENALAYDESRLYSLYLLSKKAYKNNDTNVKKKNTNNYDFSNYNEFLKYIRSNVKDENANIIKIKKNFGDYDDVFDIYFSDETTFDFSVPSNEDNTFNEIESIIKMNDSKMKIVFYNGQSYVIDIFDENINIDISDNDTWIIGGVDTLIPISIHNNYVIVSFDTGVKGISVSKQIVHKGSKVKEPTIAKRNGYNFLGWYYNDKKWDFNTKVNKRLILSAKWEVDLDYVEESTPGLVFIYNSETDSYICDGLEDKTRRGDNKRSDRQQGLIIPTNIVIPSIYNGKPVTEIAEGAFDTYLKNYLEFVTIPNTVTKIGSNAFHSCQSMKSVTIPESVTSIEKDSFSGCSELIEVINYSKVNLTIDYFKSSTAEDTEGFVTDFIDIKTSGESEIVVFDDGYLFYTYNNHDYLLGKIGEGDDLVLPTNGPTQNTYAIYRRAFYEEYKTSITIPDCVIAIGRSAFVHNLFETVIIPNSITKISKKAFYSNYNLMNVYLPDTIEIIEDEAFNNCSLFSFTVPKNVKQIGTDAFARCINIRYIINYSSLDIVPGEVTHGLIARKALYVYNPYDDTYRYNNILYNENEIKAMLGLEPLEEPDVPEEPIVPEEPFTQEEPVVNNPAPIDDENEIKAMLGLEPLEEPDVPEEPIVPEEPVTQEEPVVNNPDPIDDENVELYHSDNNKILSANDLTEIIGPNDNYLNSEYVCNETFTISANNKAINCFTVTCDDKYFQNKIVIPGGTGATKYSQSIKINVTEESKLVVIFRSNSKQGDVRNLALADYDFNTLEFVSADFTLTKVTFETQLDVGEYYLRSLGGGLQIYYIEVQPL